MDKNSAKRSASREIQERKVDQHSGVRGKSSSGQKRHRTEKCQARNSKSTKTVTFEEKPEGNGSFIDENQLDLGAKHQPNGKPGASGKAKLSARQEANAKCDLPRKSLNTYPWQEIQRHNQKTDQWLVISRKVYDVTGWADRHPGGRKVLNYYAGEDAMDVFRAMHPDPDIVRLYLKPLLIGELAPEEPNQERNKNTQLVEDFQELWRTLETMNMFNANLGFFFLHLAQILILEALALVIVWHFGSGWLITIFISFLLTVAQAQGSFLQHDMGHLSIFKKSKWNHWMQIFLIGHLKYGKNKIKFIDYEKQHLIFCLAGATLLMPVYFNMDSIQVMYRRRHWEVSNSIVSLELDQAGIKGERFLESVWAAYVTQMSHTSMKISKEENQDWFSSQVLATCNVEQSFFDEWFTGHLNFQIEHHLFPTMPRHNYHKVAALVKSLCAKHGLPYVKKPILKAFGDILRALKKSAALWMDAYYSHPET
ncbi:fatty acid desaturase 2-like protein FADS2B [Budorcas taxicolor]|uniref:fatty acid desaturase 2-like protein FADS2B n=1 Tax=Budorcas taxicolor TaxID=37181 RepID=UPI00228517C5|nr:fatty acid desaturase 2-like protein FADS2B [Budorcas taxicolor]